MNQNEPQAKGAFDKARDLFEQMSAEAYRQAEIERPQARSRRPFVKILLALALASAVAAAIAGGYGIYNFPDAPLRQKGEVYAGKHGQPRTKEDFERFVAWQNALFIAFGATFFFGFAFGIADSRDKRRPHKLG